MMRPLAVSIGRRGLWGATASVVADSGTGRSRFCGCVSVTFFAIVLLVSVIQPAPATAEDGWSFVITPQVWISHIAKNGFTGGTPGNVGIGLIDPTNGNFLQAPFTTTKSTSTDALDPQWGLQVAAQKGRLTLAGAFQYVTFETRNDVAYTPSNGLPIAAIDLNNPFCVVFGVVDPRCVAIILN